MTKKVNIWQVGFVSVDDWKINDKRKAVCRPMGYVEVEDADNLEEDVWNLLN